MFNFLVVFQAKTPAQLAEIKILKKLIQTEIISKIEHVF